MSFYQLSMNPVSLGTQWGFARSAGIFDGIAARLSHALMLASHSRLSFSFQVLSHAQSATDFQTVCLTHVNLRCSVGLMFGVLERPIRCRGCHFMHRRGRDHRPRRLFRALACRLSDDSRLCLWHLRVHCHNHVPRARPQKCLLSLYVRHPSSLCSGLGTSVLKSTSGPSSSLEV